MAHEPDRHILVLYADLAGYRLEGLAGEPICQRQSEAEALVALGEEEQRDRRLYQVLKCHGPGFCPWRPRSRHL